MYFVTANISLKIRLLRLTLIDIGFKIKIFVKFFLILSIRMLAAFQKGILINSQMHLT